MSKKTVDSNADKALPGVEFEFGEPKEKHNLVYNLYAFCKLDEATGKNPLNGEVWQDVRPKDIAHLIWAGLLHENSGITPDDIAKKVTLEDVKNLPAVIQRAFVQASPATAEEKKTSPNE